MSSIETKNPALPLMKWGRLDIRPGEPLSVQELDLNAAQIDCSQPSDEQKAALQRIGSTVKRYLRATKELLEGRYSDLRDLAPAHMTCRCLPTILMFPEGVLIRYDLYPNPDLKVRVSLTTRGTLGEWAPIISGSFLYYTSEPERFNLDQQGVIITLSIQDATGERREDFSRICLRAVVDSSQLPVGASQQKGQRPLPLISIRNEFDVTLHCELPAKGEKNGRPFIMQNRLRLDPLGWQALELYPHYSADQWDPALAHHWAEADLLAAVLRDNLKTNQFREIDPHVQARKQAAKLLSEFEQLLDAPEEQLHQFLKFHPQIISPTFLRFWSKLPLGPHVTDFVFREAPDNYLLVELESPEHLLFREDGHERSALTHAKGQITDWTRYIQDNLSTVRQELGLEEITPNPRCLIVIGRSKFLSDRNRRKLKAEESRSPTLKVITYDELYLTARANFENLLGPIWDAGPGAEVYFIKEHPQCKR